MRALVVLIALAGCQTQPMTPDQARAAAAIMGMRPVQPTYVAPTPYQIPVQRGWNATCHQVGQFTYCNED